MVNRRLLTWNLFCADPFLNRCGETLNSFARFE